MDKKDAAKTLFMEGYSQKEIASLLRLSEKTISSYATSGTWKEKKLSFDLMKDNSTQRIMSLIDYQTRMLEKLVDQWQKEPDQTPRLIQRGDIDGLQKLWTTIRKDAREFSDYVKILKEYHLWLQSYDLKLAKDSIEKAEIFINEKRKLL